WRQAPSSTGTGRFSGSCPKFAVVLLTSCLQETAILNCQLRKCRARERNSYIMLRKCWTYCESLTLFFQHDWHWLIFELRPRGFSFSLIFSNLALQLLQKMSCRCSESGTKRKIMLTNFF